MSAGPFINAIGSVTVTVPGTGDFTPSGAANGLIHWGDTIWGVATGWVGLVRYDDGPAWELRYGYWNGTTISRPTTGFVASSTGSGLTLTTAARASLVANGGMVQPHIGTGMARAAISIPGASTSPTVLGQAALTVTGTAGTATLATTNMLTQAGSSQTASATTANAQAGYTQTLVSAANSTTSGQGGWEFVCRFGTSTAIPTGRRLFVGATGTTFVGSTGEPSAFVAAYATFALDSTDTNIQLLTNDGTTGGTKINTGIPLVLNGWYHSQIWMRPGGGRVYALLIRLDTGAIYFGTTATDIPTTITLRGTCLGGLSATTGTAFTMNMGAMMLRGGAA